MSLVLLDQSEYKRLDAKAYDREKRKLRIELLKLQEDVIKNNRKICIVFEGRDTAGKSTAIKFFFLNICGHNTLTMFNLVFLPNGNHHIGSKDGLKLYLKKEKFLFLIDPGIQEPSPNQ